MRAHDGNKAAGLKVTGWANYYSFQNIFLKVLQVKVVFVVLIQFIQIIKPVNALPTG